MEQLFCQGVLPGLPGLGSWDRERAAYYNIDHQLCVHSVMSDSL